jgi:outer membrane lipoprotein-sorting protein
MQILCNMRYFSVVLMVLLCSCAPLPKPTTPLPEVTADQLLERVRDLAHLAQSLKGLARVELESPEKNFGASQVLIAEKPDRLRAETLSMFGQPVLLLTADGDQLRVLVPGQNRFYQGAASGDNLERFARVPLRLTELVHLLLYQVPVLPAVVQRVVSGDEGVRLELTAADGQSQTLDFDDSLRLVRCRFLKSGQEWFNIRYREFSSNDGFPRALDLNLPNHKVRLAVAFKQLELNPQLDPERFVLARPAGATLIELPGDR